ncbi:LCP family protein [Chryseomicrobium palamuruense]
MNRAQFKKRNSSKKRTILYTIGIIFCSLIILASTYGVYLTKKAEVAALTSYEELEERTNGSDLRDSKVEPLSDNVSILLIGIDDSADRGFGDSGSRSDSLMVATLNNADNSVKLVSIPRDTYTYIPEVGYEDKITHAHAFGGTYAAIESVESLLDIPIDYYVKMNFNAFIDVVDALNGVVVDVPYDYLELDENDQRTIQLIKGRQLLNGQEALALARTRKLDNDIERGKRQQMILESLISRAASAQSFSRYGDVIEALGDNIRTDLKYEDMIAILKYINGGIPEIETISLAGSDDTSQGVYYWQLDQDALEETIRDLQLHLELVESPLTFDETVND